jgi:hypothetical protein
MLGALRQDILSKRHISGFLLSHILGLHVFIDFLKASGFG